MSVKGAEVRIGNPANTSITVGSNAQVPQGEIRVRFTPINSETKENQNKAATEMNSPANGGNLVLDAGSTGGAVTISVAQQGTHSNGLSALIDVLVPPGFDGAVTTQTETGDVSIQGVKNSVTLSTDLGNVAVTMAGIPVAGSNGDILTKNGDITFSVPSASNLSIQALVDASNFISYDNAAGWQEIAGSTAQSATLCGGTACSGTSTGNWKIESKFGSITVKLP